MKEFYYPSHGKGEIHACCWEPEGEVKAIVQIIHGIVEYAERYDLFAQYLNQQGYLVVAEDHMGHGKSGGSGAVGAYFHGGWFAAVRDCWELMKMTREAYPDVPYILLGHSMGSFMARTMLIQYADFGITGAIICGTGWMPDAVVQTGYTMGKLLCRGERELKPNRFLHDMMFGAYNKRVERPRTAYDWLNRDANQVDLYVNDPLCGYMETAGLARDMLEGILFIQNKENMEQMDKSLPVFFVAGGDDPVGDFGKGVRKAAEYFRKCGMENISYRIYPLCRHEILNEINRDEIYQDIAQWIHKVLD